MWDPQPAVDTVVSYKIRVKDEGDEYEEKITIDKDKQTETIRVEAQGQTDEMDVISDFKRVRVTLLIFCKSELTYNRSN